MCGACRKCSVGAEGCPGSYLDRQAAEAVEARKEAIPEWEALFPPLRGKAPDQSVLDVQGGQQGRSPTIRHWTDDE